MTEEHQKSSFSTPTENSKPWTDVVTLGETIVQELRLETSVDTLGRWMAHDLAELMAAAEVPGPGQDEARRKCRAAILQLWQRRSTWPKGWPPKGASKVLAALHHEAQPERRRDSREEPEHATPTPPWNQYLEALTMIQSKELEIWRAAVITEFDFSKEQFFLKNHRDDLTENEISVIEWVVEGKDRLSKDYTTLGGKPAPNFALLDDIQRAEIAHARLEELSLKRQEILNAVLTLVKQRNERPSDAPVD